jgi:hypothetical protein
MATPETYPEGPHPQSETAKLAVARDPAIVERWREHSVERNLARLLSPRRRRALAKTLRRTANDATDRNRKHHRLDAAATARWCWTPLLHYRTAAVRTELLQIAALLERAHDPDPACVKEIHELLADGNSPLYDRGVHVSELYASLYYIRAGLVGDHTSRPASKPSTTADPDLRAGGPDTAPEPTVQR